MENIFIRRMTLEDVDKVFEIEKASFAIPWSKSAFENDLKKNPCARYLVVTKGEEILGYAGIWIVLDEGHITNIAVMPAFRGKGIGEEITKALLQYAANLGVSYATLEVRKSNIVGQNLYKKLGFFKVAVRKKYYEDNGEDGLLMVLDKMPVPQEDFIEKETVVE